MSTFFSLEHHSSENSLDVTLALLQTEAAKTEEESEVTLGVLEHLIPVTNKLLANI